MSFVQVEVLSKGHALTPEWGDAFYPFPHTPSGFDLKDTPNFREKVWPENLLKKLESNLLTCQQRYIDAGRDADWKQLMAEYEQLKPGKQVPFHWPDGGTFACERESSLEEAKARARWPRSSKPNRPKRSLPLGT